MSAHPLSAKLRKIIRWTSLDNKERDVMVEAVDALDAAAAANAEHERFVADVLHIRGEIEYLDEECKAMREALEKILECRQPQCEMCLKRARAALSMPRVNRAALAPKETR